jgi:hypothetical protein
MSINPKKTIMECGSIWWELWQMRDTLHDAKMKSEKCET